MASKAGSSAGSAKLKRRHISVSAQDFSHVVSISESAGFGNGGDGHFCRQQQALAPIEPFFKNVV